MLPHCVVRLSTFRRYRISKKAVVIIPVSMCISSSVGSSTCPVSLNTLRNFGCGAGGLTYPEHQPHLKRVVSFTPTRNRQYRSGREGVGSRGRPRHQGSSSYVVVWPWSVGHRSSTYYPLPGTPPLPLYPRLTTTVHKSIHILEF